MIDRIASSLTFRVAANKRRLARAWRIAKRAVRSQPESKYSRFANDLEACAGRLEGMRMLEIGSDPAGTLLRTCVERGKLASAVGVNPAITADVEFGRIQLLGLDARKLPFPDAHFDVAASLSVFEHVFDLSSVLAECHRVLKPGGVLLAEFGPIWSSSWGHHLWLYHDGEVVDWRTHPLPPFAHLLMSSEELEKWCDQRYGDRDLSRKIAAFVFGSNEQNRLFFSDYEIIVRDSSFEQTFIVGELESPFLGASGQLLLQGHVFTRDAAVSGQVGLRVPCRKGDASQVHGMSSPGTSRSS